MLILDLTLISINYSLVHYMRILYIEQQNSRQNLYHDMHILQEFNDCSM